MVGCPPRYSLSLYQGHERCFVFQVYLLFEVVCHAQSLLHHTHHRKYLAALVEARIEEATEPEPEVKAAETASAA